MPTPEHRKVAISKIRRDGSLQSRAAHDDELEGQIAEAIKRGAEVPWPKACEDDDGVLWLWDGFHTVGALEQNGRKTCDLEVTPGSKEYARWLAASANVQHDIGGKRRTNADKRRAVLMAIGTEEGKSKLNVDIAEHCGVSGAFVGQVKKSLESGGKSGGQSSTSASSNATLEPMVIDAESGSEPALQGATVEQSEEPSYLQGTPEHVAAKASKELDKFHTSLVRLQAHADHAKRYYGPVEKAFKSIYKAEKVLRKYIPTSG